MSGNTAAGEDEDQSNELNAAVNMLFWSHDMNQIQVDSDLTSIKYTRLFTVCNSLVKTSGVWNNFTPDAPWKWQVLFPISQ